MWIFSWSMSLVISVQTSFPWAQACDERKRQLAVRCREKSVHRRHGLFQQFTNCAAYRFGHGPLLLSERQLAMSRFRDTPDVLDPVGMRLSHALSVACDVTATRTGRNSGS